MFAIVMCLVLLMCLRSWMVSGKSAVVVLADIVVTSNTYGCGRAYVIRKTL